MPRGVPSAAGSLKADWLGYEEALRRVLLAAVPGPARELKLKKAGGHWLARDVLARATLPAWPNSAMDGYAARSGELSPNGPISVGSPVPVAGRAYPGDLPLEDVPEGAVVLIMTGGPLPKGFDTVIRVEHTDGGKDVVAFQSLDDVGRHVRPAGEDMTAGEAALREGARLSAGALAVLAAAGHRKAPVYPRPRVGILSSGDELASGREFERVIAGQAIPDTNQPMIARQVYEAGGAPKPLGVARDEPDEIKRALEKLEKLDALVTTGGASMGQRDLLKGVLASMGMELDFWRVRMRPGSPFSFGRFELESGPLPVFGLPGNPASAFVTFQTLVAPFLRKTLGAARPRPFMLSAIARKAFRSPPGYTQFARVSLDAKGGCAPCGPQGSGLVRPLGAADALALIPEDVQLVEEGGSVLILPLPDRL